MYNDLISVIMPSFNSDKYIKNSIKSILNQTYKNFELLIIDGGSTDKTLEIVKNINDPRVKIFQNPNKLNLIDSLNFGIKISKGNYLARMDTDDYSYPDRFETQIKFLKKNPSIHMLGTRAIYINENGRSKYKSFNSTNSNEIKWLMHFENQFFHSSIMIKKSIIKKHKLKYGLVMNYKKKFINNAVLNNEAEDFHLWIILENFGKICNIDKYLIKYRVHNDSKSSSNKSELNRSFLSSCNLKISLTIGKLIDLNLTNSLVSSTDNSSYNLTKYIRILKLLEKKFLLNIKNDANIINFVKKDVNFKILKYRYNTFNKFCKLLIYFIFILKNGIPNNRYEFKRDLEFLIF